MSASARSGGKFSALGVPFEYRGAMTNDYLAAMKVLRTNEVATYHGRFVSFENVSAAPMPVRSGEAWHPLRFQMDWIRDIALPQLRRLAQAEHHPVPAFCPRIKLQITDTPVTDPLRLIGRAP